MKSDTDDFKEKYRVLSCIANLKKTEVITGALRSLKKYPETIEFCETLK